VTDESVEPMREPVPAPLTRRHRLALLAAPLAAALLLSGCGGSDDDPAPAPSPTPSPSASETATPTPSPTASDSPVALSPFEDRAPVKAARAWAVALGKAVNAHDTSMQSLGSTVTSAGREASKQAVGDDLGDGYTWPGPQPFTPVHVGTQGKASSIDSCFLTRGWSVDPQTGDKVNARKVGPIQINLVKDGGKWKVDSALVGKADCSGVKVVGEKW
jgi:hypothetical protein